VPGDVGQAQVVPSGVSTEQGEDFVQRHRRPSMSGRFGPVHGLPYFVHVQARSNLSLVVHCLQDSYEPGAELRVRGVLTEYGVPVDGRATVHGLLTRTGPRLTCQYPAVPQLRRRSALMLA
jgi:hypothetical protein